MMMSITLSYNMGLRSEFRVVKSAAIYAFTSYLQLFAGGLFFLFIMDILSSPNSLCHNTLITFCAFTFYTSPPFA